MEEIQFSEYGDKIMGCFRKGENPSCPFLAVIPAITLMTPEGLKKFANSLVHVESINSTFYIDDKHRILQIWTGDLEVDNYDYEKNPLNLRSQTVYDFKNNIAIRYNKVGKYKKVTLGD